MSAKDCVRKRVMLRVPALDAATIVNFCRAQGVAANDLYTSLVHVAAERIRTCRDPITGDLDPPAAPQDADGSML